MSTGGVEVSKFNYGVDLSPLDLSAWWNCYFENTYGDMRVAVTLLLASTISFQGLDQKVPLQKLRK